jgi:hypothetical protein
MLPPNLDPVARQDSLDLLWTFIPVTVALGAMAIVLAWSSLEDAPFDSPPLTAAVAAMPGASAPLPAGHERCRWRPSACGRDEPKRSSSWPPQTSHPR